MQVLDINKVSLSKLPEEKLKFLSKDQIQSLTRHTEFNLVPASRIPKLTEKKLAKIPNPWWFDQLSGKQKMPLLKKQIQALNIKKVSIRTLPEEKLKFLTQKQVQSIEATNDFRYVLADKIKALTPMQIASIPNNWAINQSYFKQIQHFTSA